MFFLRYIYFRMQYTIFCKIDHEKICLQMSLVPYIVNELLSELDRPSYDHHFHHPYERLMSSPSLRIGYLRPWRLMRNEDSGVSSVTNDKDGFKVNLDVQQFKPEELNVKVGAYSCLK